MDFYSYYKERFTWGHNPYESVAQCQKVVMELMNDHLIPLRISAESATGYLAALYDFAGNGCAASFPFRIVQNALANAMQRAHDTVEAIDRERAKEAMEDMRADGLIPMHDPGDYEVQDVDLEGVEMDGMDDEPTLDKLYLWDKESEGSHSSQCIDGLDSKPEGLSKFILDFEHIESWGKARWAAFAVQVDTAVNIAVTDSAGVDSMVRLLAKIRDNFDRIPVESQEQVLTVADRLVLAIRDQTETIMDTMQDKHQIILISEFTDVGDWYGENDSAEDFAMELPDDDESAAFFISELRPKLDLSGWGNWNEDDWAIFDQAVTDAQVAATAEPADPVPAMHIFLGIRQNIETLELHRRFSMGNLADDLLESIKKGMAQDLFQVQKKCPFAPRPIPMDANSSSSQHDAVPAFDGTSRRWKRGQVGRESVELNFDHLDSWNLSQWAAFKIQMDKMTAVAETAMDALGQPGQILEDIRSYAQQIPKHYKKDVSQMAVQLGNAITEKVSGTLAEILQGSGQSDIADRS